jgi:hypothetical protein
MANTAQAGRVRVARQPRDQIGHWVAPASEAQRPCPHKCCRWKRPHPANLPVRLDRGYLRSLSTTDLERELDSYQQYSDTHEAGFLQVIAEVRRREDSEDRAIARRERRRDRSARRLQEHHDEVYRQWLAAESVTRGNMLNRAGRSAGIDERTLFTGPAARVRKYASPELREFFEQHGRPTAAAYRAGRNQRDIYQ